MVDIPLEMTLAALYKTKYADLSLDYIQGFKYSQFTDSIGRISFAAEGYPIAVLPMQFGVSFGNSHYPWRVSYGVGFRTKVFEFGVGCQSFQSIIPGYNSKGVSLITYMTMSL